jgi:hypothetical protein
MKDSAMRQVFFIVVTALVGFTSTFAQQIPQGVSYETWNRMQKRWDSYQSRVQLELTDGAKAEGQLILADDQGLVILSNSRIPVFPLPEQELNRYNYNYIRQIKLVKGGHPYQGLIIGGLTGIIPGAVTGIILAQGWTVIPGIVLGAITGAGGSWAGAALQKAGRKETFDLNQENQPKMVKTLRSSALLESALPDPGKLKPLDSIDIHGFEAQLPFSSKLMKAFPDNPWGISVQTGLMTNNIRKKLQNWFLAPMWGPPSGYYETRLILQADISHRIGKRFEGGVLFNFAPGDISYSYFDKYAPEYGLTYSYTHIFHQTNVALYGGYLLQPSDRFLSHRFRGSVQIGAVVSDIYEHFYFQWNRVNTTESSDDLTQRHFYKPGLFLRTSGSYFLIPGFSLDFGIETFVVSPVLFEERTVLPISEYGPQYIPRHELNFSSLQLTAGFKIHL